MPKLTLMKKTVALTVLALNVIFANGQTSKDCWLSSGGMTQSSPGAPVRIYEGKFGAAIFLDRNVALEFTLGYESTIEKDNSVSPSEDIATGAFNIGLGFQVYLGPGKKKTGSH